MIKFFYKCTLLLLVDIFGLQIPYKFELLFFKGVMNTNFFAYKYKSWLLKGHACVSHVLQPRCKKDQRWKSSSDSSKKWRWTVLLYHWNTVDLSRRFSRSLFFYLKQRQKQQQPPHHKNTNKIQLTHNSFLSHSFATVNYKEHS